MLKMSAFRRQVKRISQNRASALGKVLLRSSADESSTSGATRPNGVARASHARGGLHTVTSNIRSHLLWTMSLLLLASRAASFLAAIVQESPIGYRLSPLRERLWPVAGYGGSPSRESFRRRLISATILARPRRSVGFGYV